MPIEVTARHMHAPPAVQDYARAKAEELMQAFPRIEHVHWILDVENRDQVAELVIQGKNRIRVDATASSEHIRTAIDLTFAKAEKQMRRLRQKVQDHKIPMKRAEEQRREQPEETV